MKRNKTQTEKQLRITAEHSSVARSDWEAFVRKHPDGTVFHLPGMYEAWLGAKNYKPLVLLAVNEMNELKGVMLAVIQREPGFIIRHLSSRAVIFGGPLSDDIAVTRALLNKYRELVPSSVIYSQIRNFTVPSPEQKELFLKAGFRFEDHLNIRVDLTVSADDFWKGIKQNRKAGINKARKQGFTFRATKDESIAEQFYSLLKMTYARAGLPIPDISFFSSLSRSLRNELIWFVLEKNSKPGIILAAFLWMETLYIYYPGIDQSPDFLRLRPVDLFYYEVMVWGMQNGVKTLDWMGAGKPDREYGVRYFKQQYGGELFCPGRFEKIHRPLLMFIGRMGVKIIKLTGRNQ